MNKLFFFIALFICPLFLFSQTNPLEENKRFEFNLGIENQIPVNQFAAFYNYGLGISAVAEYKIFKKFSVTLKPGYTIYFYDEKKVLVSGNTPYLTFPVGVKYYFPYKIFIDGQLGLGIKMLKGEKESALAFSGGVGIYFAKKFNAEIKYIKIKAITTAPESIGLRIGYTFGK